MKQYPKVPRYDLPFVPQELFQSDDLHVLEKVDGMNFRFMLYEERYEKQYSDEILEIHDPQDMDILFGTKKVVRGTINQNLNNFQKEFHPGIKKLRQISEDKIQDIHTQYNGPVVWFVEHMIPHTINYQYETNPPPELIGFDIYVPTQDTRTTDDYPQNPYKEKFIGYVAFDEMVQHFNYIGIETVPHLKTNSEFDPNDYEVPQSNFASESRSEGVILRSDSLGYRSKIVTEKFKELNKLVMGSSTDIDDPNKQFVYGLVTPQRIRKYIRKITNTTPAELTMDQEFIQMVRDEVLRDVWVEEFVEIANLEGELNPYQTHELAEIRVEKTVEKMIQMGETIDADPIEAWKGFDDASDTVATINQTQNTIDHKRFGNKVQNSEMDIEQSLIYTLVGKETIQQIIESYQPIEKQQFPTIVDDIEETFWINTTTKQVLWTLDVSFEPTSMKDAAIEIAKREIEMKTDLKF